MRNRVVIPAVPYLFIADANGYQCFDFAGAFHTWDTIIFQTSEFDYIADNNKINIFKSGYYEITFEASWYGPATIKNVETDIYKNGAKVANSHSHIIVDVDTQYQAIHFVLYLECGDYIQIKTCGGTPNVCTDAASSRLIIKFVTMKDWNNRRAGSVKYPFRQGR